MCLKYEKTQIVWTSTLKWVVWVGKGLSQKLLEILSFLPCQDSFGRSC